MSSTPTPSTPSIRTPFSRMESDEDVTDVRKGAIPVSTFEVPKGYRKVKGPFQDR